MSLLRDTSTRIYYSVSYNNSFKLMGLLFVLIAVGFFCLPVQAKYGGGSGSADDPYLIYTAEQLYDIGTTPEDWDTHFKLMDDIDLSNFAKFRIIGRDRDNYFSGSFDGNGHTISNLTYIETSGKGNNVGLFGYVRRFMGKTVIKDLGLIDPNIDSGGGNYVGSLVGQLFDGTITDCYIKGGSISGGDFTGGLVGACAQVSMMTQREIVNCYCTSTISGNTYVGGLVGDYEGTIVNCYSAGNVTGMRSVGGLVGRGAYYKMSNCYSGATVLGLREIGGLVGLNDISGAIVDCYFLGRVIGDSCIGGLAGINQGAVSKCYSAGAVHGITDVGGLVGGGDANGVTDSLWDYEASGQTASAGGQGRTTLEMRQRLTFMNWDFINVWGIVENQTYPFLRCHSVGDLNDDGRVDLLDLAILAQYWLGDNSP